MIQKKLAPSSILREAKIAYYARNMFEAARFFFFVKQRDVTPWTRYADIVVVAKATLRHAISIAWLRRSVACARDDVTDFSYMTLMDTSAVKHNMLKTRFIDKPLLPWSVIQFDPCILRLSSRLLGHWYGLCFLSFSWQFTKKERVYIPICNILPYSYCISDSLSPA